MKILIDSREQKPFTFERFDIQTDKTGLPVGDYSVLGFEDRVAVERKEVNDLISCLMGKDRERFQRELAKGRSYDSFAVVVEASLQDIADGRYRSDMKPHSALQSIAAMMTRYRVPFVFAGTREGAEYMTFSLLQKYLQEIEKRYKAAVKMGQVA
ncbi:MAG: ERCC4 domain-containing protein [Desulfovibrionaceae bacterium]|nr:ERCC4 domain-containing protein [Desulfovibrionaceae bacterium]